MANGRSNSKPKKIQPDPLPKHFASLEEAGEFWDTHDSADYEEYFHDVDCKIDLKHRSLLLSLDSDLYRKVTAIAQTTGVSAETLVNLWVQEKVS
ncbi:MAG: BrnA antitoxin family protein [Acidobacteriota bacterium]|nr:BrnA antitoxin family protein [Acidobacteriota bacterium]